MLAGIVMVLPAMVSHAAAQMGNLKPVAGLKRA